MSALEPLANGHYIGYLAFWLFVAATLLMEFALPWMRHMLRRGDSHGDDHRPAPGGAPVRRLHPGR